MDKVHPLARPRPPVAIGLYGISLGGIGLMLWALDHDQWFLLVIGMIISFLGGGLTAWIYWKELSRLRRPLLIERAVWAEIVVAIVIVVCAFLLPPYLFSLREKGSYLTIEHDNIIITREYEIAENFDFRNTGELAAFGFNKGCYHLPSTHLLSADEEKRGMQLAYRAMDKQDITGFPAKVEPGAPFRTTCFYHSSPHEYELVRKGDVYFYTFFYSEYLDDKLQRDKKRLFLQCEYYKGRFEIADNCRSYRGTYLVVKDNIF